MQLKFSADSKSLQEIRDSLRDIMKKHSVNECTMRDIVLAINEACMNIIQHAYAGQTGEIQINIEKLPEQWRFILIDSGTPIDIINIKPRDLDDLRPGGLGLHFIRKTMDHVEYRHTKNGKGNILELTKNITK